MSRVGKKPIEVPQGVDVTVDEARIEVKGRHGILSFDIPQGITATHEGKEIMVTRATDSRKDRSLHGVSRSIIANMVEGVTKQFQKTLQIIGVGYRAKVEGNTLVLQLGFSHPVVYPIPDGIAITVEKDNSIVITGCDKQVVGQVAAEIRRFYPPEPYKGKGIRYKDEWVRRKAGKAVVS